MATLKKPFGRQIHSLKEQARRENPDAPPEKLAEIVNKLAREQGYDYHTTADKFAGKSGGKMKRKKMGRPKGSKNAIKPVVAVPVVKSYSAPNGARVNTVEAAQQVKALVEKFGAETVKGLAGLFGK